MVGPDNKVREQQVDPGPLADGLRVIRSGLKPTDRVVIDGLMRARPGKAVTPRPGQITASRVDSPEPVSPAASSATFAAP
ncbi:MAG: hypothetical protein WDM85_03335 [Caulobacteraceae bacterium]